MKVRAKLSHKFIVPKWFVDHLLDSRGLWEKQVGQWFVSHADYDIMTKKFTYTKRIDDTYLGADDHGLDDHGQL